MLEEALDRQAFLGDRRPHYYLAKAPASQHLRLRDEHPTSKDAFKDAWDPWRDADAQGRSQVPDIKSRSGALKRSEHVHHEDVWQHPRVGLAGGSLHTSGRYREPEALQAEAFSSRHELPAARSRPAPEVYEHRRGSPNTRRSFSADPAIDEGRAQTRARSPDLPFGARDPTTRRDNGPLSQSFGAYSRPANDEAHRSGPHAPLHPSLSATATRDNTPGTGSPWSSHEPQQAGWQDSSGPRKARPRRTNLTMPSLFDASATFDAPPGWDGLVAAPPEEAFAPEASDVHPIAGMSPVSAYIQKGEKIGEGTFGVVTKATRELPPTSALSRIKIGDVVALKRIVRHREDDGVSTSAANTSWRTLTIPLTDACHLVARDPHPEESRTPQHCAGPRPRLREGYLLEILCPRHC